MSGPRLPQASSPGVPGASRCLDGHCVTCSDEGVPMRVVERRDEGLVVCEGEGGERMEVLSGLVGKPAPGDLLLVHAGTALIKLPATDEGGS